MVSILIIYLLLICVLLGLVAFLIKRNLKKYSWDIDKMFYDEDGNHVYYERSLIEKLYFMRKYPDYLPPRSIMRLFFRKRKH